MDSRKRAETIFNDALDQPASQRAAFIEAACVGDASLLAEVQSLLESHVRAERFLEGAAIGAAAEVVDGDDPMVGVQIGAFRVVNRIGSGGMGQVYLAERVQGDFTQQAAIKIIRRGYGDEALRRFRNECQVLAMLEHPNIARMIDGGFTPDGTPFIIMEYVDGAPVDRYCDEKELSVNERLDLFRTVCDAVHHAHRHSTIHRDIKPSNILVDRVGTVKLVDFGIARVIDAAEGVNQEHTETGKQMMTPLYASPEQIRGAVLSTATDIYSLGVVLYKLLTGKAPYSVRSGTVQEMAQVLESTTPTKPSEFILRPEFESSTTLTGETRKRARQLKGDLDTIVLMSMRREPERRYASVERFSEDIHRHLRGLPVIAQADTFGYRAGKFVRRNAIGVIASAIVLVTLLASIIVGFSLYRRAEVQRVAAESARDAAQENERTAGAVTEFLTDLFEEASPEKAQGEVLSARDVVDRGAARVRGELGDEPAVKARVLKTIGDVYTALSAPDSARSLLEEAVRIEREIHGDTHQNLASALRAYGDLLADTGDHEGALENHLEALGVMERLYGPEDRRLPAFMNRIALNNPAMPFDQKIAMFRRSLAIIEQAYGASDPMVAYYLINLSGALRRAGRFEEALEIAGRSLEIRQVALEEEHPLIALSLSSMASSLNRMGRYSEALPLIQRALTIREKVYGDNSLYVTMSLNSLANSYVGLERFAEARPLYEHAIRIKESLYGEMHAFIGFDEADLAVAYIRDGQAEAAVPHLERSLEILSASYGPKHHELGYPLTGFGEAEAALGHHDVAVSYFERALGVRSSLREDHPLIVETLQPYAKSLRALGRDADATAVEARIRVIYDNER